MAEGVGLEKTARLKRRRIWQLVHHLVAHPLIGVSFGRLWAWRFHDWTLPKAWPNQKHETAKRWAGLE